MPIVNQYSFNQYVPESRWQSYWQQINQALSFSPKSILVIGVGDGVVVDYLKNYVENVQTLDIDTDLNPDIVASVTNMPIADNSFDVVMCAEVLEHIPFDEFKKALSEIKRVTRKNVIISLPHFGPAVKLSFKIPFLKEVKFAFKIPYAKQHVLGGQHFWEIGKKNYKLKFINHIIADHFNINKDFVPFDNQYHHFYILTKPE